MAYCCCTDAVGSESPPSTQPDAGQRRGWSQTAESAGEAAAAAEADWAAHAGREEGKTRTQVPRPQRNRTQPASPLFAAWWIGARPSPSHWSTSAPALINASKHAAWARDDPSSALDFFEHGTSFRSPLSSLPPSLTRSRSSIFRWTMHILTQVTTNGSLSSADARISPNLSESLRRASRRWRHASMVSTRSQDHSGVSSVNLGATERARL